MSKEFSSSESAAAHTKIAALSVLVAYLSCFFFWLWLSGMALVLYLHGRLPFQNIETSSAVLSAIGVSPIVLVALTGKVFVKSVTFFVNSYLKKYCKTTL